MHAKHRILAYLSRRTSAAGGGELRAHLGISRQALSKHMRSLVESGEVVRTGAARAARYVLRGRAPAGVALARSLRLPGLDEARVWDEVYLTFGLGRALRSNVEAVVHYAFTEMLNNAIEHSGTDRCSIRCRLDPGSFVFDVRDAGIGVFHSIASKLHFEDEQRAMIELLKGRTTTMREAHTGEGLFFTSRAADRFVLRSHRIQVEWSRAKDDVFVSRCRHLVGTRVSFAIQRTSRRRLDEVFGQYAPEEYDFQFQRTKVLVKLLQREFVSRSEAKRLLANLEKFREIVLDFQDVKSVGQGFADEVFRVFARSHPSITIATENTNPVIDAMLRHVNAQ